MMSIKKIGKKKKILLIIFSVVIVFAVYNIFGGDVTDEVYSFVEPMSLVEKTMKYKINNKKAFESFFKNYETEKEKELEKYNLDDYTIFIKYENTNGCNDTGNNKIKVTNFVSIEAQEGTVTCTATSISGIMTIAVIPNKLLWKTYTGDWKEIK